MKSCRPHSGNGTQEAQEAQDFFLFLVPLMLLVFRSRFRWAKPGRDSTQGLQNVSEFKSKTGKDGVAADDGGIVDTLRLLAGAINDGAVLEGIE